MAGSCPQCGCTAPQGGTAHALLAMLANDDVDAALAHGLLDAAACPLCADACNRALLEVRDARRFALAARDRFDARNARLQRRKAERDAARRPAPAAASNSAPALPTAAADALARALAKAKERRG